MRDISLEFRKEEGTSSKKLLLPTETENQSTCVADDCALYSPL